VQALQGLFAALPANLPAAVLVVLHVAPDAASRLPRILAKAGTLPAVHARDGDVIEHGRAYVAPPGRHLLIRDGRLALDAGAREHGHRPAIDVLFRSAAAAHGKSVVGVLLSGTGGDGTAGLAAVKAHGGVVMVQDPAEAMHAEMPRSALQSFAVDHVAPVAQLAAAVQLHCRTARRRKPVAANGREAADPDGIHHDLVAQGQGERGGLPSVIACPDCGGVLWELRKGKVVSYRCHVGHAYSLSSLRESHDDAVEVSLWTAVRILRERAVVCRRTVTAARARNLHYVVADFERRAAHAERSAAWIERLLRQDLSQPPPNDAEPPPHRPRRRTVRRHRKASARREE
jgi:two-component system, chemotaxis family, protein-glutamate methylesterase/glutaminase